MEIQHELKDSYAWKRGIRGYTAYVGKCKACNRPCNTIWTPSTGGRAVFACGQECADKIKS